MPYISRRSFNVFLPIDVVFNTIRYANWKKAAQRSGAAGVAAELVQTAVGTNTEPFFVPVSAGWTAQAIAALLVQYGVRLWGVSYFNDQITFLVKKRQAHWAQYVLLRAGVPLDEGLLDGSRANPGYRQAKAQQKEEGGTLGKVIDWLVRLLE